MCNGFCYELKQWLKAFTLIEIILCIVEAVLLALLVGFLVFLILHLSVCLKRHAAAPCAPHPPLPHTTSHFPSITTTSTSTTSDELSTFSRDQECSWIPSKRTKASKWFFLELSTTTMAPSSSTRPVLSSSPAHYDDDPAEGADDEQPTAEQLDHVLALVKLRPPHDLTFGCLLTRVSSYWALTAASCLRAVEDVEPVEGFVLLERYGAARPGRSHVLQAVVAHPAHQQPPYDVAALRSEDPLVPGVLPLARASLLDYFLVAPGDRFHLLGFGGYRSVQAGEAARALRRAAVHVVPETRCGAGMEGARHLWRGTAVRQAACGAHCGAAALCAGPRAPRGAPCNYCAGAPLVRARRLYGVMSDGGRCGAACAPETFVNIALLRDWIDTFMEQDN